MQAGFDELAKRNYRGPLIVMYLSLRKKLPVVVVFAIETEVEEFINSLVMFRSLAISTQQRQVAGVLTAQILTSSSPQRR